MTANGNNRATDKKKAEALNEQFTSVFTDEDISTLPTKGNSTFQSIQCLDIGQLNSTKAGGPDTIPAQVLHDYADELSPMFHLFLCQSYQSGQLPEDWRKALVTAIYKTGSKSSPGNYPSITQLVQIFVLHPYHTNLEQARAGSSDGTISPSLSGSGPSSGERHASHHYPSAALNRCGIFTCMM